MQMQTDKGDRQAESRQTDNQEARKEETNKRKEEVAFTQKNELIHEKVLKKFLFYFLQNYPIYQLLVIF